MTIVWPVVVTVRRLVTTMSDYPRNRVPGGTFSFKVNLATAARICR